MTPSFESQARENLIKNDRGGYTVPTNMLYPFQWNWDSGFVALGFATFDEKRAWREVTKLFEAQWPSGMVPHIIFWQEKNNYFPGPNVWKTSEYGAGIESSGISQPPVMASIVEHLWRNAEDRSYASEQVKLLLPKIERYHQWWHEARDPEASGLIKITHPWESGRDNLPDWDEPASYIDISEVGDYQRTDLAQVDQSQRPLKKNYDQYLALVEHGVKNNWDHKIIAETNPFWVADAATNAIFIRAEKDLLKLAQEFDGFMNKQAIEDRIARLSQGFERLWSESCQAYCTLDARHDVLAKSTTSATFLCFYADVGGEARQASQIRLLEKWIEKVKYLVPSYDPFSDEFEHVRYWRGPVWSVVNYMIIQGLREKGHSKFAERIANDTIELTEKGGFCEYFSPVTGEGCGGDSFSWTSAIYLALANQKQSQL